LPASTSLAIKRTFKRPLRNTPTLVPASCHLQRLHCLSEVDDGFFHISTIDVNIRRQLRITLPSQSCRPVAYRRIAHWTLSSSHTISIFTVTMEAAKTLIRTAVRTFHDTRAILIIDALFIHSVLHAEELAILLGSQPKEVRKIINPLKACRLLNTHTRTEAKVGASSTRGIQREYYYIPFHPAIDAIKFRLTRLRKKVEQMYQQDEEKKDWRCPHCKAEFMTLDIVTSIGDDGAFKCLRCGHSLLETEQSNEPLGNHEKIRRFRCRPAFKSDLPHFRCRSGRHCVVGQDARSE